MQSNSPGNERHGLWKTSVINLNLFQNIMTIQGLEFSLRRYSSLIVYRRCKRYLESAENLVHASPGITGKESSISPLPPLALAWLPSNETLPMKLILLLSTSNAPPAVIDSFQIPRRQSFVGNVLKKTLS